MPYTCTPKALIAWEIQPFWTKLEQTAGERIVDLLIRDATPDDAQALVGILNSIIQAGTYTVFDTPFSVEAEREYIVHFPPRGIFHVALRRGDRKLVGFQSMEPFASYTHAFDHVGVLGTYVALPYRQQGIGRRLFQATFDAAICKGYEKIFTYVRADNPAALASYLGQGFEVVGTARRQAKINGKYVDEVIVEKFL
jgi:L-amino acid N-acyltransferase YncA